MFYQSRSKCVRLKSVITRRARALNHALRFGILLRFSRHLCDTNLPVCDLQKLASEWWQRNLRAPPRKLTMIVFKCAFWVSNSPCAFTIYLLHIRHISSHKHTHAHYIVHNTYTFTPCFLFFAI